MDLGFTLQKFFLQSLKVTNVNQIHAGQIQVAACIMDLPRASVCQNTKANRLEFLASFLKILANLSLADRTPNVVCLVMVLPNARVFLAT